MPTTHTNNLEYRLFIMSCSIAMFVNLILLFLDTFIAKDYVAAIAGLLVFLNFAFFFYQIKYRNRFDKLLIPYIISLIIIINVVWFVNGSLNFLNTLVFILILVIIIIIAPKSKRTLFALLVFLNLCMFSVLEYVFPEYFITYNVHTEKIVINSIVIFTVIGIISYMVFFFKNQYDIERERVNRKNFKLDTSNSEIEAQNEELVQYQEEVMAQRDFIEEKNKKLEQQAIELETANEEIQAINESLEEKVIDRTKKLIDLNNDLDLLVYRSSHDFRRPLTTLMGLNEIARLTVTDQVSMELFNKVNQTAMSMDKMLLKFFMLYNINHYRSTYEGITLDDIVDKLDKNMISRKRNIILNRKIETTNYHDIDERNCLIEVILENLVENSLIYNSKEKIILDLDIIEKDGDLNIILGDNGDGIPFSYQDKIYDMYFRGSTLSTGNGLGLYVAKRAANLLGAPIILKSKEGEYCKFKIVFKI